MLIRHRAHLALVATLLASTSAQAAGRVVVGETRIEIRETIPFAPASSTIPPSSQALLDELAQALRQNPRFTKVRIEGHTDSSGEEPQNRALSQARADEVRRALIGRGVSADRLTAQGFGSADPIASNALATGRSLNRRVVLEVLAVGGHSVRRPPLAKVSARRNQVAARAPLAENWMKAQVGLGLRRSWRVQTEEESGAGITFRDASRIEMREETLVIIYGATKQRTKTTSHRAELTSGALRTFLRDMSADNEELVVESSAGDAVFTDGQALVTVTPDGGVGTVSNFQGKDVALHGKQPTGARSGAAVAIQKGYGSRVKKGQAPEPPRPLPPAPTWPEGETMSAYVVGASLTDVAAGWTPVPQATSYRVALRNLDEPAQAPYEATTDKAQLSVKQLPAGRYEARVSSVDAIGLQSVPSAPLRIDILGLQVAGNSRQDKATQVFPGDRLALPPGVACRRGAGAFAASPWVVPDGPGEPIECRTGQDRPAPVDVEVRPFVATFAPDTLPFAQTAELSMAVSPPPGSLDEVRVESVRAEVLDVALGPASADAKSQTFSIRLGPLADGASETVVSVWRRDVRIATRTIKRAVDETPPAIEAPQLRAEGDDLSILVVVTDDQSGVAEVTARWDDDRPPVTLVRDDDGAAFAGVLPVGAAAAPALMLAARDQAGNAAAPTRVPVDAGLFGPDWTLAFYALPVAAAAVPAAVAVMLLVDGGLFFALGRPPVMGFFADSFGQQAPPATLAIYDGVGAAMATALALVIVAGGTAAVYSYSVADE